MRILSIERLITILLTVVIVFEIFPVISRPVIDGIVLAYYKNYSYGVFGWCIDVPIDNKDTVLDDSPSPQEIYRQCTQRKVGYKVSDSDVVDHELLLPSPSKYSVTRLLIVHPMSLVITVILWIMVLLITFTSRMEKSQFFLLMTAVISLLAFLFSLFCFLVDLLLFLSALKWPGWLMFASTVILAICCSLLWSLRRNISIRDYEALNTNDVESFAQISRHPSSSSIDIELETYSVQVTDQSGLSMKGKIIHKGLDIGSTIPRKTSQENRSISSTMYRSPESTHPGFI
ncbi:Rim9p NDAI_0G04480 [Naumovozyma dairenensis CBS 421]|uniref:PH-response regulator protein palI/RIM9 n=1 Tax=Naumovozyma dairenensis (strain ATCC 10597 / BCRC 20456 / CBS 421 / NBRC 0211 / NRRL Y-12639) TaxID=1071378 RepID=J7SAZ9_NAUDC|nr:hypothetical protein NDAI_0G04480 [Naumovozyma dairenensis CBS 421]CCK73433.1 hypothetical protein NDAI_0G04480 [Naumovozyma dairenensis CBS 421]